MSQITTDPAAAQAAIAELEKAVAKATTLVHAPARGPRNLPKPSERKRKRTAQRAGRKANRA